MAETTCPNSKNTNVHPLKCWSNYGHFECPLPSCNIQDGCELLHLEGSSELGFSSALCCPILPLVRWKWTFNYFWELYSLYEQSSNSIKKWRNHIYPKKHVSQWNSCLEIESQAIPALLNRYNKACVMHLSLYSVYQLNL